MNEIITIAKQFLRYNIPWYYTSDPELYHSTSLEF